MDKPDTSGDETSSTRFELHEADLEKTYQDKYGSKPTLGWGPKLRMKFGYYSPDEYYEAAIVKLLRPDSAWIDVGCGRDIFPSNPELAERLSARVKYLLGVDPDDNVLTNPFIHEAFHGPIEALETDKKFDLISFRMVAEHIENPDATLEKIDAIINPGGHVVIYTPFKWAPISIVAKLTPMSLHHRVKKVIWDTEERDTFPVQYKMNTHQDLLSLFTRHGFTEEHFAHVDDCRATGKFYYPNYLELAIWKRLHKLGISYPEFCLLGVYQKS